MERTQTYDLQWESAAHDCDDDHQPVKLRAETHEHVEEIQKAKLEKRQAIYEANEKRKLERIKERYRADPDYRAKRLKISNEATKNRYRTDPEFRQQRMEYSKAYYQRKKAEAKALEVAEQLVSQ